MDKPTPPVPPVSGKTPEPERQIVCDGSTGDGLVAEYNRAVERLRATFGDDVAIEVSGSHAAGRIVVRVRD